VVIKPTPIPLINRWAIKSSAENNNFDINAIKSDIDMIIEDIRKLLRSPNRCITVDEIIAPKNAPIKSRPATVGHSKCKTHFFNFLSK
jgi:hypothetical protein